MEEKKLFEVATKLEDISRDRSLAMLGNLGQFQKAFMVASAIKTMKSLLDAEVMAPVMELQNTALGFRADKVYPVEVVREAVIEAVIRGLQPVGNQFNIVAGRCYVTKEGYTHLMKHLPGLTDLKLMPGVPAMSTGGATVTYRATWRFDGVEDSIERELPIRINAGMGADAVLGKAERKIRAAIYSQITGSVLSDGAVDDSDAIPTTATKAPVETVTEKLEKARNGSPETAQKAALIAKLQAMPPQFLARARGKLNLPELGKMDISGLEACLAEANNQATAEAAQEAERGF